MATDAVIGTFSGTGQSGTIIGSKFDIMLDFAGTATVAIEVLMPSGTWLAISSQTADYVATAEFASVETLRLNCTAYTNAVEYAIRRGEFR
jgi:hypothetical protein